MERLASFHQEILCTVNGLPFVIPFVVHVPEGEKEELRSEIVALLHARTIMSGPPAVAIRDIARSC